VTTNVVIGRKIRMVVKSFCKPRAEDVQGLMGEREQSKRAA